jgi:putative drug exporter of the RND superfamily
MFAALARFASKYKVFIVAGWVLITGVFFLTAPTLSEVGITDQSQFLPKDTQSSHVRDLLKTKFASDTEISASSALIVVYNEKGLTEEDNSRAKALRTWMLSDNGPKVITSVTSVFDSEALRSTLVSADNTTMMMNVGFSVGAMDESAGQAINDIRAQFEVHSGTTFYLSGNVGFLQDLFSSVQRTIDRTTWVTIILVIILLLFIYRSPVAAIVPLVSIGFSFLVSRGIVGFLAQAGVPVSTVTDALMVVTIFGVGTDYCLFIISRFREELNPADSNPTIENTMKRIGPIILASAITVVIAFLCLSISKFGMTRTSGWALAIGIMVTLIAGVTLVPALISLFGKHLFWPPKKLKIPSTKPKRWGWAKTGEFISRHPLWIAIPILIILVLPYIAMPQLSLSANILTQLPKGSESTNGLNTIREHFAMGEMSPLTLLVESKDGSLETDEGRQGLSKIAADLSASDHLSRVDYFGTRSAGLLALGTQMKALGDSVGPTMNLAGFSSLKTLSGNLQALAVSYPGITGSPAFTGSIASLTQVSTILEQLAAAPPAQATALLPELKAQLYTLGDSLTTLGYEFQLQGDSTFVKWLKARYFSTDGKIARIDLIMNIDPFSDAASKLVPQIREDVGTIINSSGLANVTYDVGGDAALSADMLKVSNDDFTLVIIVTSLGILVVIIILLRSIVAPLYMVISVLFNYGATLGITSWILQTIFKFDNLINMLPVFVFVMLAAVGADYNIFLVSRIREEAEVRPIKEAVQHAVAHTGNVITSCGIILTGTFATLMITDFPMVLEVGTAIAIGVLIDTFLVRALLVPALAALLGRFNWWPSALSRKVKKT